PVDPPHSEQGGASRAARAPFPGFGESRPGRGPGGAVGERVPTPSRNESAPAADALLSSPCDREYLVRVYEDVSTPSPARYTGEPACALRDRERASTASARRRR